MEKLIKAIQTIVDKFRDVDAEIDKNTFRIRVKGVQDVIEVTERDSKLHVLVLPSHHQEEDVELARIEDIIQILQKQMKHADKTFAEIQKLKDKYQKGTRIKLIKMYDLFAVPAGTEGTVDSVDDAGTIHMHWDNGRSLSLVDGVDEFEIIDEVETDG